MEKHFELIEETVATPSGVTLYRIRATKTIGNTSAGDLGGFVESERNLSGDARVSGNARVFRDADYCAFQCFGSENRTTTFFKTDTPFKIQVVCGCFFGTLEEFAEQVDKTHGDNKFGETYKAIIEVVKLKFGIPNEPKI